MPSLVSLIEISFIGDAAIGDHTTVSTAAVQAERPSRLQGNQICGRRPFQTYLDSHDEELDGWTPEDTAHQSVKRHRTNQLFKELQVEL
jgi:hypothetical protein